MAEIADTCVLAVGKHLGRDKGSDDTQVSSGQLDKKHSLSKLEMSNVEKLIHYMDYLFNEDYFLRIQVILQENTDKRSKYEKRVKLLYWSMVYSLINENYKDKGKSERLNLDEFCEFVGVNRSSIYKGGYGSANGLTEKNLELLTNHFYDSYKKKKLTEIRKQLKSKIFS